MTAPPEASRPAKALVWSFLNTAIGRLGTLAIGVIVARLLGPQEFGTYAVAFVALMAILSFNDLGVTLAVVRWRQDPAEIAPTVTTVSVVVSAVLTMAAIGLAPAYASAMGEPGAAPLVRLLSLCVLINGLVATPAALLQRSFRQRERMVVDQVNTWLGAAVTVGLALAGAGAMSLVIGRLAGATASSLLFLRLSPLPLRFGFDARHARGLIQFGLPLAGASVVVFLVGFLDQVVVAHSLGPVLLGYYVLATNLASWPLTMLSQPLRMVAPALFSRLQDDRQQMQRSFGGVLHLLAMVALPICAVLAVAAPDVVRFVYGEQWSAAGPLLRWLAMLAALRILFELAYDYLVVAGRSTTILKIQLAWVLVLCPVLWLAVQRWGIDGAGPAVFGVAAVVSVPTYLIALQRAGVSVHRAARALGLPVAGGLGASLAADLMTHGLHAASWGALAAGVSGVAVAAGLLWHSRSQVSALRLEVAS